MTEHLLHEFAFSEFDRYCLLEEILKYYRRAIKNNGKQLTQSGLAIKIETTQTHIARVEKMSQGAESLIANRMTRSVRKRRITRDDLLKLMEKGLNIDAPTVSILAHLYDGHSSMLPNEIHYLLSILEKVCADLRSRRRGNAPANVFSEIDFAERKEEIHEIEKQSGMLRYCGVLPPIIFLDERLAKIYLEQHTYLQAPWQYLSMHAQRREAWIQSLIHYGGKMVISKRKICQLMANDAIMKPLLMECVQWYKEFPYLKIAFCDDVPQMTLTIKGVSQITLEPNFVSKVGVFHRYPIRYVHSQDKAVVLESIVGYERMWNAVKKEDILGETTPNWFYALIKS